MQAPKKAWKDLPTPRNWLNFLKLRTISKSEDYHTTKPCIFRGRFVPIYCIPVIIYLFIYSPRNAACLFYAVREFRILREFQRKRKDDLSLSRRPKTSCQCQGEFSSANNNSYHCSNVLFSSVIQSIVSLNSRKLKLAED